MSAVANEGAGREGGASAASASLYVYYRAPVAQAGAVLAAIAQHRLILQQCTSSAGPLPVVQRRPASDPSCETWLERYDGLAPDALEVFSACVSASARSSGLAALAPEGRREERFLTVSCA